MSYCSVTGATRRIHDAESRGKPCWVSVKTVDGNCGASRRCLLPPALLAVSGCAASGTQSGEETTSAAPVGEKVDEIANTVPEDIKSSGKLIVGVNIPYAPNEFKDPSGKIVGFDVDLMNAIAATLGLTRGVPGGRLRQDHPLDPGRHLQRRHVVVHRHQGARGDGRLRHLLLGGHRCGRSGRAPGSTRTTPAARRSPCRPPPPRRPRSCRPRARRAPTPASRRSRSCQFDGQDAATNAVVLGQADAMSADSPVTALRDQAEQRQDRGRRRDLRLGALRLAGREGFAAGAVTAAGPRASDRDRRRTRRSRRTGASSRA